MSSTELELKISMNNEDLKPAVFEKLTNHGFRFEKKGCRKQRDTYFDTYDWRLLKKGYAVRMREIDKKLEFTIKTAGDIEDGIISRQETTLDLGNIVRDITEIPDGELKSFIKNKIHPRKLLMKVIIETERDVYDLFSQEDAHLELVFDRCQCKSKPLFSQSKETHFMEMEIERISGNRAVLSAIGKTIHDELGLSFSTESKLERAIEKLDIEIPDNRASGTLMIKAENSIDEAIHKIVTFQWYRLNYFLPGVFENIDPEFVHQTRVASRRMRAALNIFNSDLDKTKRTYFEKALKKIARKLGYLRDLDVFMLNLPGQLDAISEKDSEVFLKTVQTWSEGYRMVYLSDLVNYLESSEYHSFEKEMYAYTKNYRSVSNGSGKIETVAPVMVKDLHNHVIDRGEKAMKAGKLNHFHDVRIELKRLRYICEFIEPAFSSKILQYIDLTKSLQDCLGKLQDTVFVRKMLKRLMYDILKSRSTDIALFTIGRLHQYQQQIEDRKLAEFKAIWPKFNHESTEQALTTIFR